MRIAKGYTLMELLVVMGILLASTFVLVPIAIDQLQGSRTTSETKKLHSDIFTQQQNAFSGSNEKTYGIAFYENRYELFIGQDLASAESKEIISLQRNLRLSSINLSSNNEITFQRGSVVPNNHGSIILTDGYDSYRIVINEEGLLYYEKV